jgi:hypothetical protein
MLDVQSATISHLEKFAGNSPDCRSNQVGWDKIGDFEENKNEKIP